MFKNFLIILLLVSAITSSYADDSYDPNSGILSIPIVNVGGNSGTFYSNVQVTIANILSVNSVNRPTPGYDTFDNSTYQLGIPSVTVSGATYQNVIIKVDKILSVGGTCASAFACGVNTTSAAPAASGSGGVATCTSSSTSNTLSTDTVYYAPQSYGNVIQNCVQPYTLTAASALATRGYYMLSDQPSLTSTTNFLQIGSTYSSTSGYTAGSGSLGTVFTNYNYMTKILQFVADTNGNFRFDSQLHPNNSIDFDSTNSNILVFRNNFGLATNLYGYITFSYNSNTNLLQAVNRYKYSFTTTSTTTGATYVPSWTLDSNFSAQNYYVNLSSGIYKLVSSSSNATKFYIFNSPINFGIPSFLNPFNAAFSSSLPAPFNYNPTPHAFEGTSSSSTQTACPTGSICSRINSTYNNQLTYSGSNATTKTNADAMLKTINTTVTAAGENLRYPIALYTAFRDQIIATKLVSDSISDGVPGQNLVPYVYYTNEKDSNGAYHPFMNIVSTGNQPSPNGLRDVPIPPGSPSTLCPSTLNNGCRTRISNLDNTFVTIPLKDYGIVTKVTDNTVITNNMWTVALANPSNAPNTITPTAQNLPANVYTFADNADNGILINGATIFPVYNNQEVPSNTAGELSATGCHVGQGGGGPHCHFDAYQSGYGMGIYNDSDYLSKQHPPIIGFTYDGLALFGIYRTTDTSMLGYTTALDSFGGHNHNDASGILIGYHLHAHTVKNFVPELMPTVTIPTLNILAKGAYIGKVNSIPYFRTSSSGSFNNNQYLGGSTAPFSGSTPGSGSSGSTNSSTGNGSPTSSSSQGGSNSSPGSSTSSSVSSTSGSNNSSNSTSGSAPSGPPPSGTNNSGNSTSGSAPSGPPPSGSNNPGNSSSGSTPSGQTTSGSNSTSNSASASTPPSSTSSGANSTSAPTNGTTKSGS